MIYVFTFLGEFGYELLNWQGVIRKFSKTIDPADQIVCCSRSHLYPLYESASHYIDISEIDLFKNSKADGYFAILANSSYVRAKKNIIFDRRLRAFLKSFVYDHLPNRRAKWFPWLNHEKIIFIFSSDKVIMNDCIFGCDPQLYGVEGSIYERLDLANNIYHKIEPDLRVRSEIENQIGLDLSQPFILLQTRNREAVVRSKTVIPKERLIRLLAKNSKVILLTFDTGRKLDSYSHFDSSPNCIRYACKSFVEQACLIHFAQKCLFFTEGDFGSHIYVPPFMGKDVIAVAPRDVYELGTTPVEFWNRNVFRFGGQIIPKVSEDIFLDEENLLELVYETCPR
jgi:hypothetical protein